MRNRTKQKNDKLEELRRVAGELHEGIDRLLAEMPSVLPDVYADDFSRTVSRLSMARMVLERMRDAKRA